jgi:hypothetical protein
VTVEYVNGRRIRIRVHIYLIKTRYGYWGDGSFLLGEGCSFEFVAPWIELGVALAPAFDIEVSSDWLYFGALAYPWM